MLAARSVILQLVLILFANRGEAALIRFTNRMYLRSHASQILRNAFNPYREDSISICRRILQHNTTFKIASARGAHPLAKLLPYAAESAEAPKNRYGMGTRTYMNAALHMVYNSLYLDFDAPLESEVIPRDSMT